MKNTTLNVMYLTDNNYAVYAGVSILSLFENNKSIENIHVYVIDDSISEENKKIYLEMAEKYARKIYFLNLEKGIQTLKRLGAPTYRNSYTTYLKLFAFDLLPDTVHQIFFIDSDSIVVGDLSEIIDMDMDGHIIAAVRDGISHPYKLALGYPAEDSWFNMGVMLVDVDLWKESNAQHKVEKQLEKRNAYIAVDQDILNITQHGNIASLHPKYNATPHHYIYPYDSFMKALPQDGFYEKDIMEEAENTAVIRHFERFIGESPWHENSVHPYTDLFDKYLAISPWQDYVKQKAKNNYTLKVEKLLYRILPHRIFLKLWSLFFGIYLKKTNKRIAENSHIKNIC